MTASCWKSFSPNTATSGAVAASSLVTTVTTPSKWPGRIAPSRGVASEPGTTVVSNPGAYIAAGVGAYTAVTPAARHAATSSSIGRGYLSKSSARSNWRGLTKIEAITVSARRLASSTSAR